jgi:hypothetical protein
MRLGRRSVPVRRKVNIPALLAKENNDGEPFTKKCAGLFSMSDSWIIIILI